MCRRLSRPKMSSFRSENAAEGYNRTSRSKQKVHGKVFIQTDVCPQAGDGILDLGCGTGELSAYLAELVGPKGKVIGVDPDKERIQLARTSHSDIQNLFFIEGSAADFPGMGSDTYDIIFCHAAFHWFPEKQQVFRNMFSSLKGGGKIAINYIEHLPPFELNAYKLLNPENAERICQMYRCEPRTQIEQYASLAGFKIIKSYDTYGPEMTFANEASILDFHWATTHGVFDISLVTKERLRSYLAPYYGKGDSDSFQEIKVKFPVCRLIAVKF